MLIKEKVQKILEEFKNIKVAVIGDMMLDDYMIGEVTRISPEAPVPIVKIKKERFVLGGAANVANNLVSLSCQVLPFSVIGDDKDGKRLIEELKEKKIDTKYIFLSKDRPTIVKKRIISQNQQLLRLDWELVKKLTVKEEEQILKKLSLEISSIDAIILSDYNKGVLTKKLVTSIIKLAKKRKVIVIIDPKPQNIENYNGATSMTPNKKEALECLGENALNNINEIGIGLKDKLNLESLLITKSEEGMSLFTKDRVKNIPTFAKEVYDVTGAGDTVISIFTLAAIATNLNWLEASEVANIGAGIVVGKMGTSTICQSEILDCLG